MVYEDLLQKEIRGERKKEINTYVNICIFFTLIVAVIIFMLGS